MPQAHAFLASELALRAQLRPSAAGSREGRGRMTAARHRLRWRSWACGIGALACARLPGGARALRGRRRCATSTPRARRPLADEHGIPRVVTDLADAAAPWTIWTSSTSARRRTCTSSRSSRCSRPASTPSAKSRWSARCATWTSCMRSSEASGRRIMPIFQYRFGHGLQKLKLLIASGLAGHGLPGDGRDRLAAARRVLRGALAREVGDRARRGAAGPRDPRPRHAVLRARARAQRVFGLHRHARQPHRGRGLRRRRARDGRRLGGVARRDAWLSRRDHPPSLFVRRPGRREQHAAVHELRRPVDVRRRHARADRADRSRCWRSFSRCPSTTPASSTASTTRYRQGTSLPVTLADARRAARADHRDVLLGGDRPERHPPDRHRPSALRELAAAGRQAESAWHDLCQG